MSGQRSRRKGAQAERDLAKRFAEAMPGADVKRGIGQARSGSEVADVECPMLWPESKHGRRPNIRAALAQAVEAAERNGRGRLPVAVTRDDRKEPIATMRLDDFLKLVHQAWQGRVTEAYVFGGAYDADAKADAEAKCAAVDERDQGV